MTRSYYLPLAARLHAGEADVDSNSFARARFRNGRDRHSSALPMPIEGVEEGDAIAGAEEAELVFFISWGGRIARRGPEGRIVKTGSDVFFIRPTWPYKADVAL